MKSILAWIIETFSIAAVKSAVITGVAVAGITGATAAIVINSSNDSKPAAPELAQSEQTLPQDTKSSDDTVTNEDSENEPPSIQSQSSQQSGTVRQSTPSQQNNQTTKPTGSSNSQNSTPTPQPKPAPDPTHLTSCVYQGAPHNGSYCPYNPPPAWRASTSVYTCSTSNNLVPCPPYSSTTLIFGSVGIATQGSGPNKGQQWVSQAECYFRFPNGIQRIVSMNLGGVVTSTSNNGVLSGTIDCLTATPL